MGIICPSSQGRPHHSSALTKQMFPFLSIPVDPLYVKRKKANYWLSGHDGTMLHHGFLPRKPSSPTGCFQRAPALRKSRRMGTPHVPGRREQDPAHGRYSSLNMKFREWEKLYAPPHTTTQQSPDNVMVREATPAAGMSLSLQTLLKDVGETEENKHSQAQGTIHPPHGHP